MTVADRAAEVREASVLVLPVHRVVPADEVEELVARGELDLAQSLICLDSRRELDLIAVGIEPAAVSGVGPDDPATPAQRPHVLGKPAQRALDQDVSGRHIDVHLPAPERPPDVRQPASREALDG